MLEIDDARGELVLKIGPSKLGEPPPKALIPGKPLPTEDQKAALRAIAEGVDRRGFAETKYRAAAEILNRSLPRTSALEQGQPLQDGEVELPALRELVRGLERQLPVHPGPARLGQDLHRCALIIDLIGAGKRVGVTANSHKAICNAAPRGREARRHRLASKGLKKCSAPRTSSASRLEQPLIGNTKRRATSRRRRTSP